MGDIEISLHCLTKNHNIHDYSPINNDYWTFVQISWLLELISNDYTQLLQYSIFDKQKNDDDTIIAITNVDIISIFMINCPSLL